MQQRQPRLGDILDDYCPRERRLTNHVVVAMVGSDVKQTRCSTCDAEHEYKHAKAPRQRRKPETPAALYSHVLAGAPKRVAHEADVTPENEGSAATPEPEQESIVAREESAAEAFEAPPAPASLSGEESEPDEESEREESGTEEGPVHRPLIRATLPRPEGQAPPARPAPDFTIRQPGGRGNRFRQRQQRGPFQGFQSNGNTGGGPMRGGAPHQGGGRPPGGLTSRATRRQGPGRKRSK